MLSTEKSKMHLDINLWLNKLNLSHHAHLFQKYNGVQDFVHMDESVIRDEIGIKNSADRAKIIGSLVLLRAKAAAGPRLLRQSNARYTADYSDKDIFQNRSQPPQLGQTNQAGHMYSSSALDISRMVSQREPENIRRQLERELSQDGRRLESHAWYHGGIPRSHAESLLHREGQFLVRDSSSPGDLVLSLYWKGTHLHFIISKVVVQPHTVYECVQYRLEEEPFDSVPDLITSYVGSGKVITAATGAKITTPLNRTQPLSVYSALYGKGAANNNQGVYSSSSLLNRTKAIREYSTQSLPRLTAAERLLKSRPVAPSKPSRPPSQLFYTQQDPAEVDGAEDEKRDVVAVQLPSSNSITLPRLRKAKTLDSDRPVSATRDSFLDRRSLDLETEAIFNHSPSPTSPSNKSAKLDLSRPFESLFNLDEFQTLLLPSTENKPLDLKALEVMSMLFDAHSPKVIALHLLHDDLDVLGGFQPALEHTFFRYQNYYENRGITSGIELCTLLNGECLRQDLLERTHCLRFFVAVTILTCSSLEDRANMLSQWIDIANESKTAFGNMYGFTGLMSGLCMPQIQRLKATWNLLRQRYTSSAFTFETRLKPQAQSEVVPHAPNTTIPDLHSAILLWEASMEAFLDDDGVSLPRLNIHISSGGQDFGLDLLSSHMELVRSWSANLPMYLRNSRTALEGVRELDEILVDVFRTEFHLKFLWGSRSMPTVDNAEQRYSKFEQVLTALSERCEPTSSTGEICIE